MFNYKIFLNILLISIKILIIKADLHECNKIVIEGGDQALMKIFNDFGEIKNITNELKSNLHMFRENHKTIQRDLPYFDARIDQMPEKCNNKSMPKDCATATACTKRSGIYQIQVIPYNLEPFYVVCDVENENGDWLVIQKRQDDSVDFNRNWMEYENGFGDIDGEFFIGLKKLYALTNYNGPQELLILMEDKNMTKVHVKYDAFAIGNETESYKLRKLGKHSGTTGDSLQYHIGMKFSTKDRDNDNHPSSCAVGNKSGWWFNSCKLGNLNGKYGESIIWNAFRGTKESIPYVKMMLRRSRTI